MSVLDRKEEVYQFLKKFIAENGYAPTVREICKHCSLKSTADAFNILNRLAEDGLINKTNNRNRAYSLKSNTNNVSVPLVGTVAAGTPIFASENYEDYFNLPLNFFSGDDLFMLNVSGSSMKDIGMFDGDKIVVKKQASANNGDIVVALVDDSATVKRFFRRDGKIILHPENSEMDDFVFDEVTILGKVVGLMRNI